MARVIEEEAPREKVIIHEHDRDREPSSNNMVTTIIIALVVLIALFFILRALSVFGGGGGNRTINVQPPTVNSNTR